MEGGELGRTLPPEEPPYEGVEGREKPPPEGRGAGLEDPRPPIEPPEEWPEGEPDPREEPR